MLATCSGCGGLVLGRCFQLPSSTPPILPSTWGLGRMGSGWGYLSGWNVKRWHPPTLSTSIESLELLNQRGGGAIWLGSSNGAPLEAIFFSRCLVGLGMWLRLLAFHSPLAPGCNSHSLRWLADGKWVAAVSSKGSSSSKHP